MPETAITTCSVEPRDADDDLEDKSATELLTVHDAARLLRVTVSWVYEHTRDNVVDRLPVIKLGKYLRFDRRDLRAYLDAKRDAPAVRRRR